MNNNISPITIKLDKLHRTHPAESEIADIIIDTVFSRGEYCVSDIPSLAIDAVKSMPDEHRAEFVRIYGIEDLSYRSIYKSIRPYGFLTYMILKIERDLNGRKSVTDFSTSDIEYICRTISNMELFDDIDRMCILDFYDVLHAITDTVYTYTHRSL